MEIQISAEPGHPAAEQADEADVEPRAQTKKGLNSMVPSRAMAGEKASRADKRFIEVPHG
jgi:hypothetical protein